MFRTLTTVPRVRRPLLPHLTPLNPLRTFSTPSPPATLIKELRIISNSAPLLSCRKALVETYKEHEGGWKMEDAVRWIKREEGGKTKKKTEGRTIGEGVVSFHSPTPDTITALSLGCETDFAAKSETFLELTTDVTRGLSASVNAVVSDCYPYVAMGNEVVEGDKGLKGIWEEALLGVRENMKVRNAVVVEGREGSVFVSYAHNRFDGVEGEVGKTGAFVEVGVVEGREVEGKVIEEVGKKLAMHVVAMKPGWLGEGDVPEEIVKEEVELFKSQMEKEEEGSKKPKPDDIKEKIIKGKIGKWLKGVCLLEQDHVANGEEGGKVGKVLKEKGLECRGFLLM